MDQLALLEAKEPLEALGAVLEVFRLMSLEEGCKTALAIADEILVKEELADYLDAKEILAMHLITLFTQIEARLRRAFTAQETDKSGFFIWDWVFLKHLMELGEIGAELTAQIAERLEKNFQSYQKDKNSKWFFKHSLGKNYPLLLILGQALWSDSSQNTWLRKKKMSLPCLKAYGFLRLSLFWPPEKQWQKMTKK
jgi:hypothetical protein